MEIWNVCFFVVIETENIEAAGARLRPPPRWGLCWLFVIRHISPYPSAEVKTLIFIFLRRAEELTASSPSAGWSSISGWSARGRSRGGSETDGRSAEEPRSGRDADSPQTLSSTWGYPGWETCVWSRTWWPQCLQDWILNPTW